MVVTQKWVANGGKKNVSIFSSSRLSTLFVLIFSASSAHGFIAVSLLRISPTGSSAQLPLRAYRETPKTATSYFDPLGCASLPSGEPRRVSQKLGHGWDQHPSRSCGVTTKKNRPTKGGSLPPLSGFASAGALLSVPSAAVAARSSGDFDPANFRPVCAVSDGFYRGLQATTETVVGKESFKEYGPLIAGGLLRIRLELCVVESFFNEAVGPFIKENGISWILPLHETVETFIAGTIFALATTFILVGSTKIITVIVTYFDFFIGLPARLFGGFAFDRSLGKPVTLDIGIGPWKTRVVGPKNIADPSINVDESDLEAILSDIKKVGPASYIPVALTGAVKSVGESSKFTREIIEGLDLFVGRYLTLIATGYIGIKFLHFKIFPDFP